MPIPTDITTISKIENEIDVCDIFRYKNYTAWLSVKNLLTTNFYSNEIRIETGTKKDLFTMKGFKLILLSLKHLYKNLNDKTKKSIFLGASTGLFHHNNKTLDTYFPYYDINEEETIYTVNCGNINELYNNISYVKRHQIIADNYIFGILKKIIAKFLKFTKQHDIDLKKFKDTLKNHNIDIEDYKIINTYYDFIAGYHVYRFFFKYLFIEKAYIVSPTTKSDICAALKSLNIKIIEIQHGVVGKLHRGYNFNFKPNKLLPIPDKINVYNQFWADEIVSAGYFSPEQINIVGRLKYDIVNEIKFTEDKNYILFTGQGAYINDVVKFFIESTEILECKGLKLIYKAHPRELPSEIEYIRKEIEPYKTLELYHGSYSTEVLIKNCFAHISIFSSCHFDAIYYKNRTYIFDVMDNNIMDYYNISHSEQFIKVNKIEEVLKYEINI